MFHHYAQLLSQLCQYPISPSRTEQKAGQPKSKSSQLSDQMGHPEKCKLLDIQINLVFGSNTLCDHIYSPTATHSVLNVKLDVSSVTNIAVSKQVWTGWPDNVNDDLSLAQLGIPTEHNLYVNRKENVSQSYYTEQGCQMAKFYCASHPPTRHKPSRGQDEILQSSVAEPNAFKS